MLDFIDVHNHMAWDVDDGMDNEENARIALMNAKKDGIKSIISTPHFIPGRFDQDDYDEITERMSDLKEIAKEYGISVYYGCEVFLNNDYMDMLERNLFHSLANSKYVLLEFDVRKNIGDESEVEDIFYEFIIRGYRPLVAHVERYFHKGIDLDRIENWIEMGCFIQVNRTSILGKHGTTIANNASKLLKAGLVHVVASDTHSATGSRICKMSDVYEIIKKEYGIENADLLCSKNPSLIIEDEDLLDMMKVEKKSFMKKLWKRGK